MSKSNHQPRTLKSDIQSTLLFVGDRAVPRSVSLGEIGKRRLGAGALVLGLAATAYLAPKTVYPAVDAITGAGTHALSNAADHLPQSEENQLIENLERPEAAVYDDYVHGKIDHEKVTPVSANTDETPFQFAGDLLQHTGDLRQLSAILQAQAGKTGIQAGVTYLVPTAELPVPKPESPRR